MDQSCAQFDHRALLEQGMSMSRYVEEAVRGRRAVHEVEAELFRRVLAMGHQALGMGVTRRPRCAEIGPGGVCQGTPCIHPCRLDGGIHAADTPGKRHPDLKFAAGGLHPG